MTTLPDLSLEQIDKINSSVLNDFTALHDHIGGSVLTAGEFKYHMILIREAFSKHVIDGHVYFELNSVFHHPLQKLKGHNSEREFSPFYIAPGEEEDFIFYSSNTSHHSGGESLSSSTVVPQEERDVSFGVSDICNVREYLLIYANITIKRIAKNFPGYVNEHLNIWDEFFSKMKAHVKECREGEILPLPSGFYPLSSEVIYSPFVPIQHEEEHVLELDNVSLQTDDSRSTPDISGSSLPSASPSSRLEEAQQTPPARDYVQGCCTIL